MTRRARLVLYHNTTAVSDPSRSHGAARFPERAESLSDDDRRAPDREPEGRDVEHSDLRCRWAFDPHALTRSLPAGLSEIRWDGRDDRHAAPEWSPALRGHGRGVRQTRKLIRMQ